MRERGGELAKNRSVCMLSFSLLFFISFMPFPHPFCPPLAHGGGGALRPSLSLHTISFAHGHVSPRQIAFFLTPALSISYFFAMSDIFGDSVAGSSRVV